MANSVKYFAIMIVVALGVGVSSLLANETRPASSASVAPPPAIGQPSLVPSSMAHPDNGFTQAPGVSSIETGTAFVVSEGAAQLDLDPDPLPLPPDLLQDSPRPPFTIPGPSPSTGPTEPGAGPVLDTGKSTANDVLPATHGSFNFYRNSEVTDPGGFPFPTGFSSTNEPSVGNNDDAVLYSGNWYTAISGDRGKSWDFINPYDSFPADGTFDDVTGIGGFFCCDQVVIDAPAQDMVLWYTQHICGNTPAVADTGSCDVAGESNAQRLSVALGRNNLAAGTFDCNYLLRPSQLSSSFSGYWFDYPHLARSNQFLYATTNMFSSDPTDGRAYSVVMRFRLSDLSSCVNPLGFSFFTTTCDDGGGAFCRGTNDWFTLTPTQGATTTMYFGTNWNWGEIGNVNNDRFAVYAWTDAGAASITTRTVTAWEATVRGDANCQGPDGNDACEFLDQRVMTGWVAGGVVGFMHNVDESPPGRVWPFTRVTRFAQAGLTFSSAFDINNNVHAWVYPSVSVNTSGDIGGAIVTAGGDRNPQSTMWIWDSFQPIGSVSGVIGRSGTNGPASNRWGDYVTVRPADGNPDTWIATGFTLQGGKGNANAEPRFYWFGREQDRPFLPPNDNFISASVVSSLPYVDEMDTRKASHATNDPDISCKSKYGHSVWYRYTPATRQTVDISSTGYDTVLAVFTGTKGSLTQVDCNDDGKPGFGSRLKITLNSGTRYYIMVGSWWDTTGGNLTFTISQQPTPTPTDTFTPTPTDTFTPTPTDTFTPTPTDTFTPTPTDTFTPTPTDTFTPTPTDTFTPTPTDTFTPTPTGTPCVDLNGDGRTSGIDIGLIARALFTTDGSRRWNPAADLDGNGYVGINDLQRALVSLLDPACRSRD